MNLKSTSNTPTDHAFLSPSKFSWIRYDKEKLVKAFYNYMNVERGTKLHAIAADLISERIVQKNLHKTFNMYVNDAIKYKMEPEKLLKWSDNLFGTADALAFDGKLLRIHDLKTGIGKVHMDQLKIYAGLYCLINYIDPTTIEFELRLYWQDEVIIENPEPEEIVDFMNRMLEADKIITEIREQEGYHVY